MPDASTVEQQFVTEIAKILTSEVYEPYAIGSVDTLGNAPFRLMRGWPVDHQLNLDLQSSPPVTTVSVFSQPGQRNTTRFLRRMMVQTVSVPQPTMTASLDGSTVTFTGTGSANELISISLGNQHGMAIRLTDADTPTSVANKFATGLPATAFGNGELLLPINIPISIVIGVDTTRLREVHRQCAVWRVTIWAQSPQLRDQFCALIDPNLQALDRFFFPDGSCSGPIIGAGFSVDDVVEKQNLWKRDLLYEVEYPTDAVEIVPVMTLGDLAYNSVSWFTNTQQPSDYVAVPGSSGSGQTNL